MILLCTGEDSIYRSTSTGSDVIMTSNCIYDIFSSALLKTQMALSETRSIFKKIIVKGFRAVGSLNDSFQSSNFCCWRSLLLLVGQW